MLPVLSSLSVPALGGFCFVSWVRPCRVPQPAFAGRVALLVAGGGARPGSRAAAAAPARLFGSPTCRARAFRFSVVASSGAAARLCWVVWQGKGRLPARAAVAWWLRRVGALVVS